MSLLEKPSIYNAPSVYNQGGGDGSFTVDMGGGVKQVFTLPPYLTPVEYIDNSNYTAGRSSVTGVLPGRVEHAPRSRMDAPWQIISSICFWISSAAVNLLPLKKDSRFTFMIPITCGVLRVVICSIFLWGCLLFDKSKKYFSHFIVYLCLLYKLELLC